MKTLYTGISLPDPTFVHTPLIAIQPLADDSGLRAAACTLDAYYYLLFTSRHAVYALTPYVTALPQALRVVSIGSTTTEALRQTGIIESEQVEQDNSYGVIDWFRSRSRGRVLIPRSSLARDIIPKGLRALGYEVTTITAYENHLPENPIVGAEAKPNDGLINTNTSLAPSTEPVTGFSSVEKCYPGKWYQMPIEDRNHMSFLGLFEKPDHYRTEVQKFLRLVEGLESF